MERHLALFPTSAKEAYSLSWIREGTLGKSFLAVTAS